MKSATKRKGKKSDVLLGVWDTHLVKLCKIITNKKGLITVVMFCLMTLASFATTYYSTGSQAPNTLSNWNSNRDGISGTTPGNFISGDVFVIQSGHTMTTSGSWTVSGSNAQVVVEGGGCLTLAHTTITPPLTIDASGTVTINNGITLVITDDSGYDLQVSGTLTNAGVIIMSGSTAIFRDGGKYRHDYTTTAGTIPAADWDTSSTCEIIGYTSNVTPPLGLTQSFGNFTWNCPSQTSDINLLGTLTTVKGNFTVSNTNTGSLVLSSLTAFTMSIGGDLITSGGTLAVTDNTGTKTINLEGTLIMSAGTFNLALGSSGATNLNIGGHFNVEAGATITETSSSASTITFTKSGTQVYFLEGNFSNDLHITINSSSTLLLLSDAVINSGETFTVNGTFTASTFTLQGSGNFTLNTGARLRTRGSSGLATSITCSGTKTFAADANYEFNGTVAQSTGFSSFTIGNPADIVISNTETNTGVTLDTDVTCSGMVYINGGSILTMNPGINIIKTSSGTVNIEGTVHTANTGGFSAASGGSFQNYNPGDFNFSSTALVVYTGGSQTVTNQASYANLTITGAGTRTAAGDLVVTKNLAISGGTLDMNNHNISVGGAWSNDNASHFTEGTGTVTLSGSTSQVINTPGGEVFSNLTVSGGGLKILNVPVTVNGTLTFSSGKIYLGSNNLTMGTSGNFSGASSSSYIVAEESGTLIRQVAAGTSREFPVGLMGAYTPATIALTGGSTTDNFSVRMISSVFDGGTAGTIKTQGVVNATWLIDEGTNGGSNATVTLQWPGSLETTGFIRGASRLAHYTAGAWEYGSVDLAASGSNPYSVSRSGFTSFSPFGVGGLGALPVTWLDVYGENEDGRKNIIHWSTASEWNNDYFEVQSSADGISFSPIGTVTGAGNSSDIRSYQFTDKMATRLVTYYRIRQVDFDGKYAFSKVIAVKSVKTGFAVFNDPAGNYVNIVDVEEGSKIEIMDLNGRVLTSATADKGQLNVDTSMLPHGIYLIRNYNEQNTGSSKVAKYIK